MTGGDSAARMFVGVPLTEGARHAVEAALRRALPEGVPGRAVPAANWHLTLRFLGATGAPARAMLAEALRTSALGEPFELRFAGLGAFPRPGSARVLWAAVTDGAARLRELAGVAEAAARAAGFAREEKAYRPHLTLSRIQPPRNVTRVVERVPPLEVAMRVDEVVLFRSHPGGGPARYEAVERFELR